MVTLIVCQISEIFMYAFTQYQAVEILTLTPYLHCFLTGRYAYIESLYEMPVPALFALLVRDIDSKVRLYRLLLTF